MQTATTPASQHQEMTPHERRIFAPITRTSRGFKAFYLLCCAVAAWGLTAWIWQIIHGLGVTHLYRPVYWGVYITNFVFFIGVSHAGTLISAILRLAKAEWRRSVNRMAEVITVMVIAFGAGNVIVDLGRPDRVHYVILHPHFRSPLLWDVISISIYLTASSIYLFLPLLPDLVRLRRHIGGWRGRLYRALLMGYEDTPEQRAKLERAVGVLMILVIPVAVSVHTVVSWVFAMTIQPMWHSTIFGPFFVVGAIFSGIAGILIFMVILRKAFHLERYLRPVHFDNLGKLLLVFTLLWAYFTLAEHITTWYGNEPVEMRVLMAKLVGPYAGGFWTMVATCFVIPFAILSTRRGRQPTGLLLASISVIIGMYLERYMIVVPTLINPRLPRGDNVYFPSWVEWSILAGSVAGFLVLYLGFTKLFPIISVWEVEEGIEEGPGLVAERLKEYYPEPEPAGAGPVSREPVAASSDAEGRDDA